MKTLREAFADAHDSVVMLIFDVWKEKGSEKYGDFYYTGWYTEGWTEDGRWKASLWVMTADEKRSVDSWLYENWPKLWE